MSKIALYALLLLTCLGVASYKIYIHNVAFVYLMAAMAVPVLWFKLNDAIKQHRHRRHLFISGKVIPDYRYDRFSKLNKVLD
jgi:hypothetical protein